MQTAFHLAFFTVVLYCFFFLNIFFYLPILFYPLCLFYTYWVGQLYLLVLKVVTLWKRHSVEPCSAIPLDHQMHQCFPLCGMHVFCWDWVGTAVGMLLMGAGPQPRWLQWPPSPAVVALVGRACPLYNWLSPAVATIVLLVGISSLQPSCLQWLCVCFMHANV